MAQAKLPGEAMDHRIRPYTQNPRFWQYKGQPVMLLGANKTDSPYMLPDQKAFYDALAALGGNYARYVVKQRLDPDLAQIFPYRRLDDGRYDLNQWDEEYWQRFAEGLKLTAERDIIVQVELWDRFDVGAGRTYAVSPWRPANNINYTEVESGLPESWTGSDERIHAHPFFQAAIEPGSNPFLLGLQQRHVDRVLSFTLQHDHVLYVITNESTISTPWSSYWAGYIRGRAKAAGKQIEVSEMPWTLAARFPFDWQPQALGEPDRWISHVIDNPDLYSFCAFQFQPILTSGQSHYDRLTEVMKRVRQSASGPRPVNAVKVFASRRIIRGASEPNPQVRYWRILMAGWAAVSLHREHPGTEYLGFSEAGQHNLSAARRFCDAIVPWECEPRLDLLQDRQPDSAYLLANPGRAYGVYFPTAGTARISMGDDAGRPFELRWISIETGQFVGAPEIVQSAGVLSLSTPEHGSAAGWAATLVAR
jgi:hypothetical protein